MYNKHGLAMDSFEREYRIMNGKPVPYKFLGYDSLYDLLVSIPDVVNVMQVTGGQFILIAVPDEKTAHVAKMVGNQRDNVEGFNRRTAALISQCGKVIDGNKIFKNYIFSLITLILGLLFLLLTLIVWGSHVFSPFTCISLDSALWAK